MTTQAVPLPNWTVQIDLGSERPTICLRDQDRCVWLRLSLPTSALSGRAMERLAKALNRQWQNTVTVAFSVVARAMDCCDTASCATNWIEPWPMATGVSAVVRARPQARRVSKPAAAGPSAKPKQTTVHRRKGAATGHKSVQLPVQLDLFGPQTDFGASRGSS